MPRTLTPQQTPSGSPSAPGSTTIPVPLVDQVTVGSITPMAQAAINNAAYLAALLLGPDNAPPNAQPPLIAATGPGSGPSRKQTLLPGQAGLAQLSSLIANPLDVVNVPGISEYVYVSPYATPAWAVNTLYTVGQFVANSGAIFACIEAGRSASSGSGPTGAGWWIEDGTEGVLWNSITFAGGDGIDYVSSAAPSSWLADKFYAAGTFVFDPANTANYWLAIQNGTSSDANPFPSSGLVMGSTQVVDGGSGATLTWQYVGTLVGQWVSLNALSKGFPANVRANVGTQTTGESFQPQVQGLVQSDHGGTVPLPYLPLTAAPWVGGTEYRVGDRVSVQAPVGFGGTNYWLLTCITAGTSGGSPPGGGGVIILPPSLLTDGTNGLKWLVVIFSHDTISFAKQLAYTEGGTSTSPGTVPIVQLPMANTSDTAIAGTQSGTVPLSELQMANTSDTAIAGTQSGKVPLSELAMANASDTAIAGTQSGKVPLSELSMANASDTAIAGTQSGKVPLSELSMANASDTAIAGTQDGKMPVAELPVNVGYGIAGLDENGFLLFQTGSTNFAIAGALPLPVNTDDNWSGGVDPNHSAPYYYKTQDGLVHLEGTLVAASATSGVGATLPSGYIPANDRGFAIRRYSGTLVGCTVGGASGGFPGTITFDSDANDAYFLDGISFLAAA